jgi:hypothetical protein
MSEKWHTLGRQYGAVGSDFLYLLQVDTCMHPLSTEYEARSNFLHIITKTQNPDL